MLGIDFTPQGMNGMEAYTDPYARKIIMWDES